MKIIGIFLQKKSCALIHRKLDRDITKILLKAALNTIIPIHYVVDVVFPFDFLADGSSQIVFLVN
jgi:hypothetical protein